MRTSLIEQQGSDVATSTVAVWGQLADGVGFEPTRDLRPCRFSRPVPSTARPPIRFLPVLVSAARRAPRLTFAAAGGSVSLTRRSPLRGRGHKTGAFNRSATHPIPAPAA